MIATLLRRLKAAWCATTKRKAKTPSQQTGYTKEEAQKVKERLQGLGYLD